ncbi:TPA: fimbrial protein [Photobacterium damselae]
MKKLLLVSVVSASLLSSGGVFAKNLEVHFNGAISESACEPVVIEDGAVNETNSIDLGTYTVAEATAAGGFGTVKNFSIGQKDTAECTGLTSVEVRVSGVANPTDRTVLNNLNSEIPNIGVMLKDKDSATVLNTTKTYDTPDSIPYTAQLFNVDGNAPKTGLVTSVVDYTIAYK